MKQQNLNNGSGYGWKQLDNRDDEVKEEAKNAMPPKETQISELEKEITKVKKENKKLRKSLHKMEEIVSDMETKNNVKAMPPQLDAKGRIMKRIKDFAEQNKK
jgi:predicted RNase H-like nuclease (RuvC/YqgF family)